MSCHKYTDGCVQTLANEVSVWLHRYMRNGIIVTTDDAHASSGPVSRPPFLFSAIIILQVLVRQSLDNSFRANSKYRLALIQRNS